MKTEVAVRGKEGHGSKQRTQFSLKWNQWNEKKIPFPAIHFPRSLRISLRSFTLAVVTFPAKRFSVSETCEDQAHREKFQQSNYKTLPGPGGGGAETERASKLWEVQNSVKLSLTQGFSTSTLLTLGAAFIHRRISSSVSGLYPMDTSSSTPSSHHSCGNPNCFQTLSNISWGTQSPPVEWDVLLLTQPVSHSVYLI